MTTETKVKRAQKLGEGITVGANVWYEGKKYEVSKLDSERGRRIAKCRDIESGGYEWFIVDHLQLAQPETPKLFDWSVSWDRQTIARDKEFKRGDGLYPDSVLWGVCVNGICNPTVAVLLDEIKNAFAKAEGRS